MFLEKIVRSIIRLFFAGILFGCFLLVGCSDAEEPNEYVTSLERFVSFSNKGNVLISEKISSSSKRGFADFTGDGLEDMYEIRDVALGEIKFELWLFEAYADQKTKLLKFSDPYSIEIKDEKTIKWGEHLIFDTADVNGDGRTDIVLSQYIENWGEDEFNLVVSLNTGIDRKTKQIAFKWVDDIYDHKKKDSFTKLFLKFLAERETALDEICIGNRCGLSDRYRLKWADMDGNETDDLVVLWRDSREDRDLFVEVFYTNAPTPSDIFQRLTFSSQDDFLLKKIFSDDYRGYFGLSKIVTGDFNGDGFGDVVLVAEKTNEKVLLKFALNTSSLRRYDGISFMTDATTEYPEVDWDLLSDVSDKVDMVDLNFDGCTDYSHVGESSYFPAGGKGREIKNLKTMYYMLTDCEKAKKVKANLNYSEKPIGVRWPDDRVPREKEKVVGASTAVSKK